MIEHLHNSTGYEIELIDYLSITNSNENYLNTRRRCRDGRVESRCRAVVWMRICAILFETRWPRAGCWIRWPKKSSNWWPYPADTNTCPAKTRCRANNRPLTAQLNTTKSTCPTPKPPDEPTIHWWWWSSSVGYPSCAISSLKWRTRTKNFFKSWKTCFDVRSRSWPDDD